MRSPHRTLVRATALALALLAATGCDDGPGILGPERGIAGTWVRYQPGPAVPSTTSAVPLPRDTIVIDATGTGRWSVEIVGVTTTRMESGVLLDPRGLLLFLNYAPCEVCRLEQRDVPSATASLSPARPRSLSVVPPPHWRVVRHGDDRLELVSMQSYGPRQYFMRLPPVIRVPE